MQALTEDATSNHFETAKLFLSHGSRRDLKHKKTPDGVQALLGAATSNHFETAELFLSHGSRPFTQALSLWQPSRAVNRGLSPYN